MYNEQKQSTKRAMYILSLDNNRIFWIGSISVLIFVFLFLLGYWIGNDKVGSNETKTFLSKVETSSNSLDSLKVAMNKFNSNKQANITTANDPDSEFKTKVKRDKDTVSSIITGKQVTTQKNDEYAMLKKDKPVSINRVVSPVIVQKIVVKKRTIAPKPKVVVARKSLTQRTVVKSRTTTNSVYSSAGRYAIQVASVQGMKSADNLKTRLQKRNFRARIRIANVKGKKYYRVKVGNFQKYTTAQIILAKLRNINDGKDSFIVKN